MQELRTYLGRHPTPDKVFHACEDQGFQWADELSKVEDPHLYALGFRKGDVARLRSSEGSAPVSEMQFHTNLQAVLGYHHPNFDTVVANCARDGWQSMDELNSQSEVYLYALGFRKGDVARLRSSKGCAPVSEEEFHTDLQAVLGYHHPNFDTVVANCARDGWQSMAQLVKAYDKAYYEEA